MGDPGLFGPDSVTWRVHSDATMLLGGVRALLLQALHPLAMAGVAQHSDFREDPWGRLFRTARYVTVTSFGTTLEARQAGLRVRSIHDRLAGVEPESGAAYRVSDPHLLLWVHCCETDSFLSTYRRAGGRVSPADADRYLEEQVSTATLVGIDPYTVPASTSALRDYFASMQPELRSTAAARDALRFVLWPPLPTRARPLRPAWAAVAGTAYALLPRWARRLYGVPALPTTDLAGTLSARALRSAVRLVPAHLREAPEVRAARRRVSGEGGEAVRRGA